MDNTTLLHSVNYQLAQLKSSQFSLVHNHLYEA